MVLEGSEWIVIDELDMIYSLATPILLNQLDVPLILPIQVLQLCATILQSETLIVIPLKRIIILVRGDYLTHFSVHLFDFVKVFHSEAFAIFKFIEPVLLR